MARRYDKRPTRAAPRLFIPYFNTMMKPKVHIADKNNKMSTRDSNLNWHCP